MFLNSLLQYIYLNISDVFVIISICIETQTSFVGTEKSDKGLLFEDTKSQKKSYSSPLTGSWTLIFGIIVCVFS